MIVGFNPLSGNNPNPPKKKKPHQKNNTVEIAQTTLAAQSSKNKVKEKGELKLIPLDKSDPFFDTDLVVFRDDYTGILPLNGIKESKLKEIKDYLDAFQNDQTKFKFNDSDPALKQPMYDAFKLLLTRRLGRELLFKLEKLDKVSEIKVVEHSEHMVETNVYRKSSIIKKIFYMKDLSSLKKLPKSQVSKITKIESKLYLNPSDLEERSYFTIDSNGDRMEARAPFAIGLAHELVHVLYSERGISFKKQPPTLSLTSSKPESKLGNREEQATITGLGSPIKMEESKEKEGDFFKDWGPKSNE